MKKLLVAFCCSVALSAFGCNSNNNKEETPAVADDNAAASKSAETTDEEKNSRWEQRKAKGDTLALSYKELQTYLPEINGYTREGGPKGSQMNMPGMGSWSEAEQEYRNGEKRVSVKIMDYNAAWQAFKGITAIYGMGFSTEDDEKKQSHTDMGMANVYAYQTIYKSEPKAELVVIIADRFLLTLDCEGETGENFLKDIAKSMKLDKLSSL